ncbi:unnamed protein product [Orchesella dallaii]|uniref:C2H2-type domain-containing protein n=1 Tax=Orchesella dallaii TaxID=48710 RepID=A0ABP1QKM9_9HEXA
MAEFKIAEVVPVLNQRCAMGRVVVTHVFPKSFRPRETGKFYFCCKRAFLTDESFRKHRSLGGCADNGDPVKDARKSDEHEQAIETESNDLSDPSTVKCHDVDDSLFSLEKLNLHNGTTTNEVESENSPNSKLLPPRRKNTERNSEIFPTSDGNERSMIVSGPLSSEFPNMALLSLLGTSTNGEETLFQCRKCAFSTNKVAVLIRHIKSSHKAFLENGTINKESAKRNIQGNDTAHNNEAKKNFTKRKKIKCAICNFTGSSMWALSCHKKIAHVENGRFNCVLCNRVYATQKGLRVHLSALHKVSDGFQTSSLYLNARRNSTNIGERDDCNRVGVQRSEVDGYSTDPIVTSLEIKGKTSAKAFSCDLCPYATRNNCQLRAHKQKAHDPKSKYPCSYCSCRYKNISILRGHISTKHKKASSPSNSLQLTSSNKNSLVANWLESIRSNERAYGTQDERMSSQNNSEVKQKDSSNRYQCKSCPRAFSSQTQLISHYRQKHMYKSSNTARTEIKQFSGVQMFLNKNTVTCLICERNFSNAQQLANHELACHVKGGSYPCSVKGCKCVFGRKQSLATHLKRWHMKAKTGITVAPSSVLTPQCENGNSVLNVFTGTLRGASPSVLNTAISSPDPESHITCSICRFVVNNHEELHSHRSNVHLLREVECVCGCSFATATELTNHKNYGCRESKKEKLLQSSPLEMTPQLPKRMSRSSRNLHTSDLHLSNQEKAETADCINETEVGTITATTEKTTIARTLLPSTDFDKQPSLQCSKCSRTFYNEKGLQCHFIKMHLGSTCRACEICQYPTPNLRCYKYHKKTCHVINGIQCPDCQCSFKSIEGLSIHVSIIHKRKLDRTLLTLNCNQCSFIAYLQTELDNHVQRIHVEGTSVSENEIKKFQCPSCDFTTFGSQSLEAHKTSNHVENGVACMFCNNTFNTVVALNAHRRIHSKELTKPEYTYCKICQYQICGLKSFQQHNQRCHVKNGVSCPDCPCSFKDVYCLTQHMRMMHKKTINKQDYMVRCPTCDFRTLSEGDLRRHVKVSHTKTEHNLENKEPLKCHICDITIKDSVESHIKRSHVEGGHACSDCKCSFKNERGLRRHLLLRHGKRVIVEKVRDPAEYKIQCNNCDFRCKSKLALNQHSLKMHGLAVPFNNVLKVQGASRKVCNLCKIEFAGTLSAHNKYHHVENGFRCTHCCCTFETFKHRVRHMHRIHNIKIPSMKQCSICELKYFGTFDKHFKNCHVENGVKCKYCACTFESENGMIMHSRKRHAQQAYFKKTVCHLCETRLGVKLEHHLERCHVQNGYRCTGCSCSFETEAGRSRHMWKRHGVKLPLSPKKCQKCGIVPLQSMSYHMKHSHAENGLNCTQCASSFDTERRRSLHLEKYHNVKIAKPPTTRKTCEICKCVYSVPYHEHLTKNHVRNGYPCSHCKCSFRTKAGRKFHVVHKHKDAPKVSQSNKPRLKNTCPLCGLELSESLEMHQKRNHSLTNQFKCGHCSCRFSTYSGRRCHVAAFHKTRKAFIGAQVTDGQKIAKRSGSVDNLFECNNCSCSFRTELERTTHTELSHCVLSGSSSLAASISPVRQIDNTSSESTPASKNSDADDSSTKDISICLKCGFQASSLSRLKMHSQKSHVKNSAFPCKLCSCGYATEHELARHMILYHPDSA